MAPASDNLTERLRLAVAERRRGRAQLRRLLAQRRALIRNYAAIVEDAHWFATMAQRDMGIPAKLDAT